MRHKLLLIILFIAFPFLSRAEEAAPMRRPVSVNNPMFIIHIDTWNWPDPQKIINLVPEDLKPWCVFNISLSVSHNETTGEFNIVPDGLETARSWVRTCAENRVWCMVQPASGAFSHLPDNEMEVYEEFYREYPNFIGFNYCEQFWGFRSIFSTDPLKYGVDVPVRLAHFAKLMDLSVRYGGYLTISWCGGIWHWDSDPLAMMKRDKNFLEACKAHPDNLIMCYKYTSAASWYNNESLCLGTFISGLTNNYGIRFDECGWALDEERKETYPTAAGIAPVLENIQLTGMTVMDGPELIWKQCFYENGTRQTPDGYTSRRWARFSQFDNIWVDMYRKILDGTLRIPTRKDVIGRTQLALVNDVNTGSTQDMYATPNSLYDGLYKQDGEGSFDKNTLWFKKTGRYGAIPIVPGFYNNTDDVKEIPIRLRTSGYAARWKSVQAKVDEINEYAPEEYEGNLFAGRMKNAWVTYYPYRYGKTAWAKIPFKYNTCDSMRITYSEYSSGLIHEYSDHVTFYLNNYRVDTTDVKTDELRIYGSTAQPDVTWKDRGAHVRSTVTTEWKDGVYIIKVSHNGAVELDVKCAGKATGRLTDIPGADIVAPAVPPVYMGPRQYEGECFDYKNVGRCVTNGVNSGVKGYTAQGYMDFGTKSTAMVKDTVNVPVAGKYRFTFRYRAADADVMHVLMYLNSTGNAGNQGRIRFTKTGNEWLAVSKDVELNQGDNVFYLRANATVATPQPLLIDNVVVELIEETSGIDGVETGKNMKKSGRYYDLTGRRVVNPVKGVYIRDGRKTVVK